VLTEVAHRRIAWALAAAVLIVLLVSTIIIVRAPTEAGIRYWEFISSAITGSIAPVLGLIILKFQRNNRIGWLLLVYGATVAFSCLAQALYIMEGGRPTMPSDSTLVLLMISEITSLSGLAFMGLLMLWFPDGKPPSRRWRFLQWWLVAALAILYLQIFAVRIDWTPQDGLGADLSKAIENPIGFIPAQVMTLLNFIIPLAFFSILIILVLAVVSVFFRYRASGPQVRAQLKWFILGSLVFAFIFVIGLFLIGEYPLLAGTTGYLGLIAIYLPIGIAITRYHLYDIDLVIRRTLIYGALSLTLGLVFLGAVTLLQSAFSAVSGQRSAISVVVSTLLIAALFSPLRRRIQNDIDRRFYRRKYNAEHAVERFAASARQSTDLEALSAELLAVVGETMQPERVSMWLMPVDKRRTEE
jgi:hypothetical protein